MNWHSFKDKAVGAIIAAIVGGSIYVYNETIDTARAKVETKERLAEHGEILSAHESSIQEIKKTQAVAAEANNRTSLILEELRNEAKERAASAIRRR